MMTLNALLIANFVAANPEFIAWVLGGLISSIAGLLVGHYALISNRLKKLEEVDRETLAKVESHERTLVEYKEHIGARQAEIQAMSQKVKEHMDKEEREVWAPMREIRDTLNSMQLENVEAHAALSTGQAVLAQRVTTLEQKMPNGQLTRLVNLLEAQTARPQVRRSVKK